VPYQAKVELISRFIEGWQDTAHKCADKIIQTGLEMALEQARKIFGSFKYADLDRAVR